MRDDDDVDAGVRLLVEEFEDLHAGAELQFAGSSAIRTGFPVARARAMATRCCSPPDNWWGKWWARDRRGRLPQDRHCPIGIVIEPAGDVHPELHVLERSQRLEQVERLEHEGDCLASEACQLPRDAPTM